ncbi:MAG: FeGP cofactor biosynthesis protein HcgF family protein, partial [Methanobrevibacter sp.]|nr:FeGP cofactor biosynthesis protein HcgF family protein [Methanobrevibacter sp.]
MIKIATAECFTQGKIGRELHALAQNYKGNFGNEYIDDYGDFDYDELSVTCSLFIPTIEAVEKILNVKNPPKPDKLIKGIKVYDEKG